MGRRGVNSTFKLFLPVFATHSGGGRGSAACDFIPHPPPPQTLTVCINSTFSLGRGEEVREKIEGQQYTSIVPLSMGATVPQAGSKIPTNEWMYFQSIKSVKHNAAMSVNRSILKKSRHIGIGLLQCNLSTLTVLNFISKGSSYKELSTVTTG